MRKWIRFTLFVSVIVNCLMWSMVLFAAQSATSEVPSPISSPTSTALSVTPSASSITKANDPLEPYNRAMFKFNYHFDRAILKPVAEFYNKVVPKPLNQGIHNFFMNINQLPIIANDVLQLRLKQTGIDLARFVINTTIGVGGLFDVASRMKLDSQPNDFGLTLARWGYKQSTYLVLPFFGVMTIRDGIGIPVDYYAFSIYPRIRDENLRDGLYLWSIIDKRVQLLNYQSVIEEAAVDRYVFIRNAYLQRREYLINQILTS